MLDDTVNCALWRLEGVSDLFDGADGVCSSSHLPKPSKNNGFLFELCQVAITAPSYELYTVYFISQALHALQTAQLLLVFELGSQKGLGFVGANLC